MRPSQTYATFADIGMPIDGNEHLAEDVYVVFWVDRAYRGWLECVARGYAMMDHSYRASKAWRVATVYGETYVPYARADRRKRSVVADQARCEWCARAVRRRVARLLAIRVMIRRVVYAGAGAEVARFL